MNDPREATDARQALDDAPTGVRYRVLLVTTLASVLLYLDRNCIAELLKYVEVKNALDLSEQEVGWSLSAFFWSYALGQVPSGWLSDRFGARAIMTLYVVAWSGLTALTGLANGFIALFALRLSIGVAQAGAYPTSGAVLSRWMPLAMRGLGSSVVTLGGRAGGAGAPFITTGLILLVDSWQLVMILYGLLGVTAAALFWAVVRERPEEHPRTNSAERRVIAVGRPRAPCEPIRPAVMIVEHRTAFPGRLPVERLIASPSMWLMCVSQFTTNIGWVFLVTWLNTYMTQAKHVDDKTGGWLVTLILLTGMPGMLLGGFVTDAATRAMGLRWGRSLPLAVSRFTAGAAFFVLPWLDSYVTAALAFAAVAFSTDLGVPGCWAYMQDVGGKHVGSILGWGNMWGNLGAAVSPPLLEWLNRSEGEAPNWNIGFAFCAVSFVISGLVSLGIDATKPIEEKEFEGQ
jgi:ACS family glucarate transporter-like MFS transporter